MFRPVHILPFVFLASLFGAVVVVRAHRATPPQVREAEQAFMGVPTPRDTWAVDLLARLGNTQPSAGVVRFLVQWSIAEDAGGSAFARNNPLNTTLCLPGRMTGAINGDGACGVQGYATYEDGLEATTQTLAGGAYTEIVAGLLGNDPQRAYQGLIASPWAESHYGWGESWPRE